MMEKEKNGGVKITAHDQEHNMSSVKETSMRSPGPAIQYGGPSSRKGECNITIKLLELKQKIYTSITYSFLHFKSIVAVYKGKPMKIVSLHNTV